MTKEDRKRQVLQFLADTGLALPPKAIYVNMEGITFSEKSIKRYMPEMADEGLVDRLDGPAGYYRINEAGREYLEDTD